jgi:hypothetical protein
MPMFAWGLDEIAESVVLIYVFIIGLLVLLVNLERGLYRAPRPRTRLVRQLSRRWVADERVEADPVVAWIRQTSSWDLVRLSRKLHLSRDEAVRLLRLSGYSEARTGEWRPGSERRGSPGPDRLAL